MAAALLVGLGVWIRLTERHQHEHIHEIMEHEHVHDEHRRHGDPAERSRIPFAAATNVSCTRNRASRMSIVAAIAIDRRTLDERGGC